MNKLKEKSVYNLVLVAMFSAIIVICTWIAVPAPVPFTLQTLGVFLAASLLSFKYSFLSVAVYILLGFVGLPVFSGFQGGVGVLLGPTGGYIVGFLFIALSVGLGKIIFKGRTCAFVLSMVFGLLICYLFGTLWFMTVTKTDFISAFLICVMPYLVFDGVKLLIAVFVTKKINKSRAISIF